MKIDYKGAEINLPFNLFREELEPKRPSREAIDSTIIATTTMYPEKDGQISESDKMRANLALKTIEKATAIGYTIAVLDGGSSESWRTQARNLDAVLVEEDLSAYPGHHFMGRGRRQILDFAGNYGNHEVVLWMEPEKHTFILPEIQADSPSGIIAQAVFEGLADAVVPRRNDSLQAYPLQQQVEELLGNVHIMEAMRDFVYERGFLDDPVQTVPYLDLWIGPRAICKDTGLQAFLNYHGEIRLNEEGAEVIHEHDQWESIFAPLWKLMLQRKRVRSVPVDYVHPVEQTDFEKGNSDFNQKRLYQLEKIIQCNERLLQSYDWHN